MVKIIFPIVLIALFIFQYDLWFIEYVDISTIFVSLFALIMQITGGIFLYKECIGWDKFEKGLSLKRKK